jgi:hypothetical protein
LVLGGEFGSYCLIKGFKTHQWGSEPKDLFSSHLKSSRKRNINETPITHTPIVNQCVICSMENEFVIGYHCPIIPNNLNLEKQQPSIWSMIKGEKE